MSQSLKILLPIMLYALIIFLGGCTDPHEKNTKETRAFMERYLESHNTLEFDLGEVVKFYHHDLVATYYIPSGIETFTSAQQYFETYKPENLPHFNFDHNPWSEPLLLLVDGENAVVRYIGHARTFNGEYHNHYIHMYKIRDDKIVEYHAITNPHSDAHYERNRQFLQDVGLRSGGE